MAESHIPDVNEKLINQVDAIILNNRQYCYVLDPIKEGIQHFGTKELRKGEQTFFLKPGERLESTVSNIYVLSEEQSLLLRATMGFTDESGTKHEAGDR